MNGEFWIKMIVVTAACIALYLQLQPAYKNRGFALFQFLICLLLLSILVRLP